MTYEIMNCFPEKPYPKTGCYQCAPGSGCKPDIPTLGKEEQEYWSKIGYWGSGYHPFVLKEFLKIRELYRKGEITKREYNQRTRKTDSKNISKYRSRSVCPYCDSFNIKSGKYFEPAECFDCHQI